MPPGYLKSPCLGSHRGTETRRVKERWEHYLINNKLLLFAVMGEPISSQYLVARCIHSASMDLLYRLHDTMSGNVTLLTSWRTTQRCGTGDRLLSPWDIAMGIRKLCPLDTKSVTFFCRAVGLGSAKINRNRKLRLLDTKCVTNWCPSMGSWGMSRAPGLSGIWGRNFFLMQTIAFFARCGKQEDCGERRALAPGDP